MAWLLVGIRAAGPFASLEPEAGSVSQPAAIQSESQASDNQFVQFSSVNQNNPNMIRGAYGRDDSPSGLADMAAMGFNTVNGDPYVELLDEIHSYGLKAIVWMGGYSNETCSFGRDDNRIRELMEPIVGHPATLVYHLADEPNQRDCPNAPDQFLARSNLIKSLDPGVPTYLTLMTWDGAEEYPFQYFAHVADIIGLIEYPCNKVRGCSFNSIDEVIAEADIDGIQRYWAVVQAFGDEVDDPDNPSYYELPTMPQMYEQMDHWRNSRMEGYMFYTLGDQWVLRDLSEYSVSEIRGLVDYSP
ncbi:MAG: hypothetical protein R3313_03130 [Candidatus Saccharimonadales bacterium]|nr:hypothetical protein [Candidatus Saccharimonadales bacterium]